MNNETRNSKHFHLFLIAISIISIGLALYATVPYGAGISGDAARNLSTAENLLKGKGFIDLFTSPLVFWPPLYPLILAGLGQFTNGDVFLGGWYLNVLLAGLNVYLSGELIYRVFKSRPVFYYMGSLFAFLSLSSFRINVNIASDPLYITFSLFFLIATGQYHGTDSKSSLYSMIIFSVLAGLQRFVGVILIVTGACIITHKNWKDWRTIFWENIKFGMLTSLPLVLWIVWHNIQYGYIGGNPGNIVQPLENTRMTLLKILHWFIPYQFYPEQLRNNPWVLIFILLLILLLLNRQKEWSKWWEAVLSPYTFSATLFFTITIFLLIFSIATPDHQLLDSDRYYIGILTPLLILIFHVLEHLIFPHLKLNHHLLDRILFVFFAVWSIYPLNGFHKFIQTSRDAGGIVSYNIINTKAIRDSVVLNQLKTLTNNSDIPLYSNDPKSVWFITRQDVLLLPWLSEGQSFESTIKNELFGWPPQKEAYIIWLIPDQYEVTVNPDELSQVTEMKLISSAPDGNIYLVTAINQ